MIRKRIKTRAYRMDCGLFPRAPTPDDAVSQITGDAIT